MERADIAIIGTGPAGISAAITATVRNKKILLFGSRNLSDKIRKAQEILNYPGMPGLTGPELAESFHRHLKALDIPITDKKVNAVYAMGDYFGIQASGEMYEASSVILATGVVMGRPLEGEKELLGRGVSYCATCDAMFYRKKTVAVVGYHEEAEAEADYLAEIVGKVYYFPVYKKEPHVSCQVEIVREIPLAVLGDTRVEGLRTKTGEHPVDGVFILRDAVAPEQLVPGLSGQGAHVEVDLQMQTNIPGLFACGDLTGKPYQYIKAAGQGNVAALSAVAYLSGRLDSH